MVSGGNIRLEKSTKFRLAMLPTALFLIVGLVIVGGERYVRARHAKTEQKQLKTIARQAALRLQDYIRSRLLAVESLSAATKQDFYERSTIVQQKFGGFQAINLVKPSGLIASVVPLEGNRGALGKNVLKHKTAHLAFKRARKSKRPAATTPLELFQGGRGFATYFPVLKGAEIQGYLNGVFRIAPLVRRALAEGALDTHVVIIEGGGRRAFASVRAIPAGRPTAKVHLRVLDQRWHLTFAHGEALWVELKAGKTFVGSLMFIPLLLLLCLALYRNLLLGEVARLESVRRQRIEQEMRQRASLEALGRFAGGIAHDFNNVLSLIVVSAEFIQETAGSEGTRKKAEDIILSGNTAASFIEQLRLLSNSEEHIELELDLREELERVAPLLHRLLPFSIQLIVNMDEELPKIRCVSSHISQILLNLVVNAVDSMQEGGRLSIRLRNDGHRFVLLEVEDTGCGIPQESIEHVFELYFTTKSETGGTGVGLATVQNLVVSMGGDIKVESEAGRGSLFTVRFPVRELVGRG